MTLTSASAVRLPWVSTDTAWLRDINHVSRESPWLHAFMAAWAVYGGLVALVLLTAGAYWWAARRRPDAPAAVAASVWVGLAAIIALWLNQVISHAVARPRPFRTLPHLLVVIPKASDFSFPSDHATIAGAIAVSLLLLSWRIGLLAWALALFLAFARVYVGAHYPEDVIAGLLFGVGVALAGWLVFRVPLTLSAGALARTPLRPLVTAAPTAGSHGRA
ncbi:MAG: phosphatase PAP2 family protein [Streptosporangiaceae bacterium]